MEPRTESRPSTSAGPLTAWDRLVRYISDEDQTIRYGEPIVSSDTEDLTELADSGKLEVRVCEGTDAMSMKPTSQKQKVKTLLGPLAPADVPIVRCIGLNYKSHILETGMTLPENPTIFLKGAPAVTDHDSDIPIPQFAQAQADYEGELTVVIGKDAKNVSEADALDYVAGYTVGNDVSARDWQMEHSKAGGMPQWSYSKGFDKYAPLGPCLVSARILGDAGSLKLTTLVNGEKRQDSTTADLCFGVRQLVAFCSQGTTLQRGSLIMTGTPSGVGFVMDPPTYLKHGDEVTVEIERIGRLRNHIAFE